MLRTIPALIDDFDGQLARTGHAAATRASYRWTLWKFADAYHDVPPDQITREDCERFLNRWTACKPATMAQRGAALAGFTAYLADRGILADDPMRRVARPKRQRPDKLDVVTVSGEDVRRMFNSVRSWPEALALALLAYTGARRGAAAGLRWRDVDLARGEARFRWKGGTIHTAVLPAELVELFTMYSADVQHGLHPDDYVIPNLQPRKVRRAERDDRIVWNIIRTVAHRAGVRSHVHALRAAFAVVCLDEVGLDPIALKDAMGHERIESTMVYLRRRDRRRSLEQVRALSWGGSVLSAKAVGAHTGFEPVLRDKPVAEPSQPEREQPLVDNDHFRAMLARLQATERPRR